MKIYAKTAFLSLAAMIILTPLVARAQVDETDSSSVPRVLGEVVLGFVGEAVVGGMGWGIGAALCDESASGGGFFGPCFMGGPTGVVGLVTGAVTGAALGTYLFGEAVGGDGSFGATLLGSGLGLAGMFALVAAAEDAEGLQFLALSLPAIGATIGYELSRDERPADGSSNEIRETDSEYFSIHPTVSVLPQGAALGLTGSF